MKKEKFILLVLAILLSACNTLTEKTANPTQTILNDDSNTFVIDIPKKEPGGETFNIEDVLSRIKQSLSESSKYKPFRAISSSGGIVNYAGVKYETIPNGVVVKYLREEISGTEGTASGTRPISVKSEIQGVISVAANDLGNRYKITISAPKTLVKDQQKKLMLLPMAFLDKDGEVVSDINGIVDKAGFVTNFRKTKSGEINTPYSTKSIYANFARSMSSSAGKMVKQDGSVSNIFTSMRFPEASVYVAIYPYRNGSKIEYQIAYDYEYSSSTKSNFKQGVISSLQSEVEKVAAM